MPGDDQVPEIPKGVWEGHEQLGSELSRPHGVQQIIADKRPLNLDYLPQHPTDSGTYVYLALVYPLIDLKVSLWEYYHSQSDIDLRPRTYITGAAPFELYGTRFHEGKEAHRLHWQPDAVATKRFLEFIRTLILKQDSRRRVWALSVSDVEIPYPDGEGRDLVSVKLVLPYSPRGAFLPAVRKYELGRRRARVVWKDLDTVAEFVRWRDQQNQLRFDQQAQGRAYVGREPQDVDAHPFYKAEEMAAAASSLWRTT